jgi:hypothetical protein
MAKNIKFRSGIPLTLPASAATYPTTPAAGDPVILAGSIPGVALIAEDADNEITAEIGPLIAEFSVKGVDDSGNSAVVHGNKLYYVDGDDPVLSKKATGIPFGIAFSSAAGVKTGNLVAAGATTTIRVLLIPANGILALTAGIVDRTHLADNVMKFATVEISAADIVATDATKLGHAAGVPLVADPGAGKVVELISAVLSYSYDTAQYGDGGNVTININGGAALTGVVSAANSLGAAADKIVQFVPLADAAGALTPNKGLNLVAASAFTNPGTAAGTVKVFVTYRILDLA